MFRQVSLVYIFPFVVSCNIQKNDSRVNRHLYYPPEYTPTTAIVEGIAQYNRLDGSMIGLAGQKSIQYKRFEVLCQFSEDSLVSLTDHNNPVVRAYAFEALVKNNSSKTLEIFEKHIRDKASFDEMFGCIVNSTTVNIYFYSCIKNKLSKSDKAEYKKKIRSQFAKDDPTLLFFGD